MSMEEEKETKGEGVEVKDSPKHMKSPIVKKGQSESEVDGFALIIWPQEAHPIGISQDISSPI